MIPDTRRFPLKIRVPIVVGAAIFVLAALVPPVANAATPKCFGKTATIVSSKATINGTNRSDVIFSTARSGFNQIDGKGGNDLICGGNEFDFISGGPGHDKLRGRGDLDFLVGGTGDDHLYADAKDGGNADDVWYQDVPNAVDVNLQTGRATGEGTDTLHGIDGVFGSQFDDTITGDDRTNFIWGNGGNDTIMGGGGLDLIDPGDGNDTSDGGTGTDDLDIYYVSGATGPTQVDLAKGTATGAGIGTDSLTDMENVVGSNYNDLIDGDEQSNILFGGPGNDSLNGRAGFDYASYWFAAGRVEANLQTMVSSGDPVISTDDQGNQTDLGEGKDAFQQIEGLLGTIEFDDRLVGDDKANYLDGDGGNDTISAGAGNDWIVGGLGNDTVDGGDGTNDFWDYYGSEGLTVDLSAGTISSLSLQMTIKGVESVAGADKRDIFIGDVVDNTFYGWGGNDTFTTGEGNDKIDGGAGDDSADPGPGADACWSLESLTGGCETLLGEPVPQHPLQVEASAVAALRRNF